MGALISIEQLEPDKYITDNLVFDSEEKTLLIRKNVILTERIIKELKKRYTINGKVKSGFIEVRLKQFSQEEEEKLKMLQNEADTYHKVDSDIPSIIDLETKNEVLSSLKESVQQSQKNLENNLSKVKGCIEKIADEIQLHSNFRYSLGQYKNLPFDEEQYAHALRVTQFSIALANIYNKHLPVKEMINLEDIGTAALLHEFGLRFQNPGEMEELAKSILNKDLAQKYPIPADLLQQPYQENAQTIYTYMALSNFLPPTTRMMILLSNAKDNSSYHKNTKPSPSKMAAKIISLCNVYDTLLQKIITNQSQFTMEDIKDCMDKNASLGIINEDLKNLFFDNIPLYSVGVRVQLSTEEYAIVVGNHLGRNHITRPIVKVLETGQTIDLLDRNNRNITIKKIIGRYEDLSDKLDMERVITADKIQMINSYTNNQLQNIGIFLQEEEKKAEEYESNNRKAI